MGEKLKNAPVYFTIAQVRHNPVLRLDAYTEEIQDRMRKVGYPDFKKGMAMSISLMSQLGEESKPQPPVVERVSRLMFFNSSNTQGFIVEQNAISFQATEYDTFEVFASEFLKGIEIVHECVTLAHTERIGLRYLDAVVPPDGEKGLPDYLAPGVLGISGQLASDIEVALSSSETHFRVEGCAVLARTIIRGGRLGFPMDLQPIGIKLSERFEKINGVHAIVDTDASIEGRFDINIDGIEKQLLSLKKGVGVAFKAIVTDTAINAWK